MSSINIFQRSGITSSSCFIPFRLISFFVLALTIMLYTSKICFAHTSQNLLADPGFEEGSFVWQRVGSDWSSSMVEDAYTGFESQEMTISEDRISREVYQDIPVNGGSSYSIFGWVKTSEISGSASIMIQWLDPNENVLSSVTIAVSEDTQDWVLLSDNFIAPVDTDIARFRLLTNDPDGSGTAWFDDLGVLVNQPPVLNLIGDININEGDTLTFAPTATDPAGDFLVYSYSGWITSSSYTTGYQDAGTHIVTVTVSDGALTDSQDVTVVVTDVNVAPVLESIADIMVNEGETVLLNPTATDLDGDALTFSYAGWMTSDTYTTNFLDAGVHTVTVTVSDGTSTDSQDVMVTVAEVDVALVLNTIQDITVSEGETVLLNPTATDLDGDILTFSYAGWMTSNSYTTNHLDAGVHTVTVTVSDGKFTDSQDVTVTVTEADVPPILNTIADITVNEGDAVLLNPTANGLDGEELTFSYAGWMTSNSYTTNHLDAGVHTVTVTVSDGNLTDSQDVTITVTEKDVPTVLESIVSTGMIETTESSLSVHADVAAEATGTDTTVTIGTTTDTDEHGNNSTDTQNATVSGTQVPLLTVPADVTTEATGTDTTVAIGTATATDIFTVTMTNDAPATYPLGTTVVTWTATDEHGNSTTGTQNVTVSDTQAPSLTVPADVTAEATGTDTTVAIGTATATDIFTVTMTNDAPATYPLGTTVVTWTATDEHGNSSTGTQNITVQDTTAPVITMLGSTPVDVQLNSIYTDAGATASDGYDGALEGSIVTVNNVDTSISGTHTVTYNATDSSGNPALEVTRTVNVIIPNQQPVLTLISDQIVNEGVTVSISALATDPEGDSLSYTFSGWINYSGPNNTVSKDTSYNDPSTDSTSSPYSVTIVVSDGNVLNDISQKITITVLNTPILSWNASNDPDPEDGSIVSGVAGYKVHYEDSSGNYNAPVDVGNVTFIPLSSLGLIPGQTYYITVSAYDGADNDSSSNPDVNNRYSNVVSFVAP